MTTVYAKDFQCTRCKAPKRQAVVFVGGADPDLPQFPMCREHADEWRMDLLMEFFPIDSKPNRKGKKR